MDTWLGMLSPTWERVPFVCWFWEPCVLAHTFWKHFHFREVRWQDRHSHTEHHVRLASDFWAAARQLRWTGSPRPAAPWFKEPFYWLCELQPLVSFLFPLDFFFFFLQTSVWESAVCFFVSFHTPPPLDVTVTWGESAIKKRARQKENEGVWAEIGK